MRILVAYDGSVCGDGALFDLAAAGLPSRADILVMTVANSADALSGSLAMAERARRYLAERFAGWRIRCEAFLDSPARGILSRAGTWKPDLIVMGTHGHPSPGQPNLGSVTQKILLHSTRPVRIARARIGADPSAPRLILGMDGSPGAFAALGVLAARNWPKHTQVRLLAAVDWRESLEGAFSPIGKRLRQAAAKLSAKGLTVTHELRLGEPRRIILQEAKTWSANCVFLGSRGMNPYQGYLLGSVSTAVAFHAPCSVEVIRKANPPAPRKDGPSLPAKAKRAHPRKAAAPVKAR
ncbi:MAG: Universal stress protein UspA-like nucleotide-binding protein [Fibrobacteres bacterium]|nr:Universal stress protein UspA-like nucleotide-binding protein [Fibrobacterota bacterium]